MRGATNVEKTRIHMKGENHPKSIPYQLVGQDLHYGNYKHCFITMYALLGCFVYICWCSQTMKLIILMPHYARLTMRP